MSAFVLAPLAVALLFLAWVAVHALVRRASGLGDGEDVLGGRSGCGGCARAEGCAQETGRN